ncbi:MAG: hypothetical protein QXI16_02490, partial [Sulfolobaceae archaeon]
EIGAIEDAPSDGKQYARKDETWSEVVIPSSGVQSVTGDGVDNTDPENPVLTFPTPADIGALDSIFTTYSDINALIADQGNQVDQLIYEVVDASGDSNITFPAVVLNRQAFYRYNGTATGSIDDYTLISAPFSLINPEFAVVNEPSDLRAYPTTGLGFFRIYVKTRRSTFVFSNNLSSWRAGDQLADDGGGLWRPERVEQMHVQERINYLPKDYASQTLEASFGFDFDSQQRMGFITVKPSFMQTSPAWQLASWDEELYFRKGEDETWEDIHRLVHSGNLSEFIDTLSLKEEEITGTRLTDASVTGSTPLDWDAYKVFEFTLTGATTLTDTNLPTGTETKVIELVISGNQVLTLPAYWEALPSNDAYDGTVRNHLVVSCIDGDTNDIIYSLQNLSS